MCSFYFSILHHYMGITTFFLVFVNFYIFAGYFTCKIPFYVNLLTKSQKKRNFVSIDGRAFLTAPCSRAPYNFHSLLKCRGKRNQIFYRVFRAYPAIIVIDVQQAVSVAAHAELFHVRELP